MPPRGGSARHELLVRMVSRDGDIVPPGAFLPVAERFDLIQDIDRWVVNTAIESTTNQLVVQSLVTIARGLGKQTIAEYVGDDDATVRMVREYGVDFAPGFHLGRPRPHRCCSSERAGTQIRIRLRTTRVRPH